MAKRETKSDGSLYLKNEGIYVLDLETTTDRDRADQTRKELLFADEVTFICAVMYAPMQSEKPHVREVYGREAAENEILDLPPGVYYTWNGAKFDSHFIFHLLRKAGFQQQEDTKSYSSKQKQLRKFEYSYMLAGSRFITLKFRNDEGVVEIRDACLLFSCSLAMFINNTCPEYKKLNQEEKVYDYYKWREFESDFTEVEKQYCRYDIYGFSVGLNRIREQFNDYFHMDILSSYTAGSFAMKFAKKKLERKYGDDFMLELFPKVSFDRQFVVGGKTVTNEDNENLIVDDLTKIDKNSSYPAAMVYSKLPYGKSQTPTLTHRQLMAYLEKYPEKYVFARLIRGSIYYKDQFSPIAAFDAEDNRRRYPTHVRAYDNVFTDDNVLRDPKLAASENTMWKCYIFKSDTGIFDYMEELYELKNKFKKEGKKGLELAVKIILNATYGKFIQRKIIKSKDFFDGIIKNDGGLKRTSAWYQYEPIGAAITANSRYEITRYQNLLGQRFHYTDTDSLVFSGPCPEEIPLGDKLGEWKIEASPEGIWSEKDKEFVKKTGKGIFFQRKTYVMEIDKKLDIVFCGISNKAKDEFFNRKEVKARLPRVLNSEEIAKAERNVEELRKQGKNPYDVNILDFQDVISIEEVKMFADEGMRFKVLEGNQTLNGVVLVERAKMKRYSERL